MADINSFMQGNVAPEGKQNWRGDQVAVPQGGQSIYETSSVPLTDLGSRKVVGDRVFRYAKAGGAVGAGAVLQQSATAALDSVTAGGVQPAGAKMFTWYAATAIGANDYAEGYIISQSGTAANLGLMYRVKSHAAIAKTTTGTLYLYDPLVKAIDVTDEYTLMKNVHTDLTVCTNGTAPAVGVAPIAVTTNDYFWLQTWGPCNVKASTVPAGDNVSPTATGQVGVLAAAGSSAQQQIIGHSLQVLSNSEYGMVFLEIAP